eukprot:TRINITY_DN112158_c0_g1_i1.p1 TRINITY_DN112158_c0_g1~~TRINITY_DN112158_c0_g1_i1.p1  ORF type:complete len:178 (-),score=27.68 TRINITY_DN112158_c0_g1_i1:12-467(-)
MDMMLETPKNRAKGVELIEEKTTEDEREKALLSPPVSSTPLLETQFTSESRDDSVAGCSDISISCSPGMREVTRAMKGHDYLAWSDGFSESGFDVSRENSSRLDVHGWSDNHSNNSGNSGIGNGSAKTDQNGTTRFKFGEAAASSASKDLV